MIKRILDLCELCGVSSDEEDIAEYITQSFSNSNYTVEIDPIGNVHVFKPQLKDKPNVLIFAHMDEIGFIIRKIENNGFARFERMGGVNRHIIPGCKVVAKTKHGIIDGVIGLKSHHFMPDSEKFTIPQLENMYIDFLVESKEELINLGVDVGTLVSFKPDVTTIREKYIVGKSLDNRACVGVLLEVANQLNETQLNYNLHFAFPVLEEFNIRGLMPLIRKIQPYYSIGLDITPACDTPDLTYNNVSLGLGPAITFMNFHGGGTLAGVLPNKELNNKIISTADYLNIDLQREISPGVITENAFAIFENFGVRVANLSIPTRYTHTPIEVVQTSDLKTLCQLLLELTKESLNQEFE